MFYFPRICNLYLTDFRCTDLHHSPTSNVMWPCVLLIHTKVKNYMLVL